LQNKGICKPFNFQQLPAICGEAPGEDQAQGVPHLEFGRSSGVLCGADFLTVAVRD
jgi:hypothetical protein